MDPIEKMCVDIEEERKELENTKSLLDNFNDLVEKASKEELESMKEKLNSENDFDIETDKEEEEK